MSMLQQLPELINEIVTSEFAEARRQADGLDKHSPDYRDKILELSDAAQRRAHERCDDLRKEAFAPLDNIIGAMEKHVKRDSMSWYQKLARWIFGPWET